MSEIELLPCPRCGTIPKLSHDFHAVEGDRYWTTCECRTDWKLPRAAAIAESNRRSPPQAGMGMEEMKWSLQAAQAELRRLPSPNVYGALHKLEDIIRALSPPSDGEDKGK